LGDDDEAQLSRVSVAVPDEDLTTQELKVRQLQREEAERRRAAQADTGEGTGSHRRRADKAQYLRQKLEEREQAERDAGLTDD
jgi:hypothetical protein